MTFKCRECGKTYSLFIPFSENVQLGLMQFFILIHMVLHHREYMTAQKTIASFLTIFKGFVCFLFELMLKLFMAFLYPFYWIYTSINTRWY